MLQYLLTFVVLAQPAATQPPAAAQPAAATQPAAAATQPAAAATQPAAAPSAGAGDATQPAAGADSAAGKDQGKDAGKKESKSDEWGGDPCHPKPKKAGAKKKEMPPPPARTDIDQGTFWLPPAASTNTDAVDWLFYGILGLTIFCFTGITLAVVILVWKYRGKKGDKAEESSSHNDTLEITWTIIPSIICVVLFVFGWRGFLDLNTPPKHAYEIQVTGEKWNWSFKYPNGWVDSNLHVPVNEPIRLVMRSKDVIHSFFVPAFRVKQDVLPNRYTRIWFQATKPGVYRQYCAEYCGTGHSQMKRVLVVHPSGEAKVGGVELGSFKSYMEAAQAALMDKPPVELGKYIYETRGCQQCHSITGEVKTGPSWKGIFGETHQLSNGPAVKVNEDYIRESVLDPTAKVRAGFNPVMPTFKGQLTDEQIDGVITFIKCLK